MKEIDYYKNNEILENSYYQIPQELFVNNLIIDKFIHWICVKFDIAEEDNLIRDFEFENNIYLDPDKQIEYEENQNDYDMEL